MDRKYIKLDFEELINFDWVSFENLSKVNEDGIWLFKRNASEYRWLSDEERDLLLSRPDKDTSKPVLPFPFTLDEFLKFATLPAFALREFYTFADNTIDENAIERLGRTNTRTWELARALMFGERPKCISPEAEKGELAIADAESMVTASASGGVEPDKAGPVDKRRVMKKAALIKKHIAQWPTINRDFQDSSENDLSKAAKASKHGEWFEVAALNWAEQRGKLEKEQGQTNLATVWTGKKHTIEG